MKKPEVVEVERIVSKGIPARSKQEWVDHLLTEIHAQMTESFNVRLSYFGHVELLSLQEFQNKLAQRMQDDFKDCKTNLKKISPFLEQDQTTNLSEHFAFYNPKNDTLYMNEKMVESYPERVVSVCAHELAEKLLSSYRSPTKKTIQSAMKLYLQTKENGDAEISQKILQLYIDSIFETMFKEGCCEAIAVQVLRNMKYTSEADFLEKELQDGYPKCIGVLSLIENAQETIANMKPAQPDRGILKTNTIIEEIIKSSQVIKGISYFLGYPLAKVVLEKYGLDGTCLAIESAPPFKVKFFIDPQSYSVKLGKMLRKPKGE